MNDECREFEEAFLSGTIDQDDALAHHPERCLACGEKVKGWRELTAAARNMRRTWESPNLWPRIERALIEESRREESHTNQPVWIRMPSYRWLATAACAAILMLSIGLGWVLLWNDHSQQNRASRKDPDFDRRILTEQALKEVENAEVQYIQSIEKLSKMADPLLQKESSPILLNYRQRLMLLDEAIAECRANIGLNRSNAHLRRELVSIYQEKQRTLENLMKEKLNDQQ